MFNPESCDDNDGNDQHDSRKDQNDAEEGHHSSEPVDLLLDHIIHSCCSLHPTGGRSRGLVFVGTHCYYSEERGTDGMVL